LNEPRPTQSQIIDAAPGVARIAGEMWWRAAKWGAGTTARNTARLARAAADPVLAAEVVGEIGHELREYARDLLGITELDERVRLLMPPGSDGPSSNGSRNGAVPESVGLRARGAALLRAAAQVDAEDHAHPAYARILTELAPDEGRILRLLAKEGAQASVDIRATNLIGVSSQLIAGGMNMIGAQAGVQHRDRVPAYLNNLERLGLIWFSREPIEDTASYQVLEAQPDVLAAIRRASRAKTVQRSINLTPFGEDFCQVCLPLDTAEMEALAAEVPESASGAD
jgi:Abortive infection alpha